MNIEYYKWYSSTLGRDMELKRYGYDGKPCLIFPCQGGRFFEWEDLGMLDHIFPWIEAGKIQLFAVDSVDNDAWASQWKHPGDRTVVANQYLNYLNDDVVPFIHNTVGGLKGILTSGASMGAYHAMNFFLKRPDAVDAVIAMSGLYRLNYFIGDYMDEHIYYHSPLTYLPGLDDPEYLDKIRRADIIVSVGQGDWEDEMVEETRRLQLIFHEKQVPAWFDYWGHDVEHDWPWWKKQLPYFLGKMFPLD